MTFERPSMIFRCYHRVRNTSHKVGKLTTKCAGCGRRKMWPWITMTECLQCGLIYHKKCFKSWMQTTKKPLLCDCVSCEAINRDDPPTPAARLDLAQPTARVSAIEPPSVVKSCLGCTCCGSCADATSSLLQVNNGKRYNTDNATTIANTRRKQTQMANIDEDIEIQNPITFINTDDNMDKPLRKNQRRVQVEVHNVNRIVYEDDIPIGLNSKIETPQISTPKTSYMPQKKAISISPTSKQTTMPEENTITPIENSVSDNEQDNDITQQKLLEIIDKMVLVIDKVDLNRQLHESQVLERMKTMRDNMASNYRMKFNSVEQELNAYRARAEEAERSIREYRKTSNRLARRVTYLENMVWKTNSINDQLMNVIKGVIDLGQSGWEAEDN